MCWSLNITRLLISVSLHLDCVVCGSFHWKKDLPLRDTFYWPLVTGNLSCSTLLQVLWIYLCHDYCWSHTWGNHFLLLCSFEKTNSSLFNWFAYSKYSISFPTITSIWTRLKQPLNLHSFLTPWIQSLSLLITLSTRILREHRPSRPRLITRILPRLPIWRDHMVIEITSQNMIVLCIIAELSWNFHKNPLIICCTMAQILTGQSARWSELLPKFNHFFSPNGTPLWEFHHNLLITFWVMLQLHRQTNRPTTKIITSLSGWSRDLSSVRSQGTSKWNSVNYKGYKDIYSTKLGQDICECTWIIVM